ncbi:MAG: hypothetical protein ER33_07090 [Cyanobium sp. CACIAM 14]|nr:MAG: hypothetical protein ER33_07090 [Cyanobium sp. CACIAM 14]
MATLAIANTITDLIQGDVREHLPLERIPLQGDILGLGTTTSLDNGELTFLHDAAAGRTRLWKCQASDGGIHELRPGDGSGHFPYVCFSDDAAGCRQSLDPAVLGTAEGRPLQELVREAIAHLRGAGRLEQAPIYGVRLLAEWRSLVITVASKLCMGQLRRNRGSDPAAAGDGGGDEEGARALYGSLQHFRIAASDPGDPKDPIRFLGASRRWECCGFWDTEPSLGRVTVPLPGASLHIHGCSTDLRHGGHLHHEHAGTRLARLESLAIYPLQRLRLLSADLAVEQAHHDGEALRFRVANRGDLDVSDVGIAVVLDDRYSDHRYLRLPWLAAGASQSFRLPLLLPPGRHEVLVLADPERDVLEPQDRRANNGVRLELEGGHH